MIARSAVRKYNFFHPERSFCCSGREGGREEKNGMAGAVDVILLASGFSRRFGGGNKLLRTFRGKTLIARALELACSLSLGGKAILVHAAPETAAAALRSAVSGRGHRRRRRPAPRLRADRRPGARGDARQSGTVLRAFPRGASDPAGRRFAAPCEKAACGKPCPCGNR